MAYRRRVHTRRPTENWPRAVPGVGLQRALVGLLILGCSGSAAPPPVQEGNLGGSNSFGGSGASTGGSGTNGTADASGGILGAGGNQPGSGGTSSAGGSDAGSAFDAAAVVVRYDYGFDLRTREAVSSVLLMPQRDGYDCVTLKATLPLRDTVADGAFSISPTADGVALCGSFQMGHDVTFSARQSVPQQSDPATGVGFSRQTDRDGNTFAYLLGWLEQCPRFGPCDPAPERLSHFVFNVTHDPGDVVLCPGSRSASTGTTRCEVLGVQSPTYSSFAIASDPGWSAEPLVAAAGVSVVIYDTPSGSLHASLDAAAVADYLEWITALLGPFPYGDELRVAASPVVWLGMEHPANIVVRDDLASIFVGYANTPLHVVLHEIAHQWAGNRTTLESTLDYLWKEAIAEYLAYAFEEQNRPPTEAASARKLWHGLGIGSVYPIRPTQLPAIPLEDWTAGGYGSAPLALFVQLEPWVGRPALLAAIQRFLREPVARDMEALRAAIEAEAHVALRGYFDAWIYGTAPVEWPELSASVQQSSTVATVSVTQSHPDNRLFPCVVDVQLTGGTKTAVVRIDFGLQPSSRVASADIAFDEPVLSLQIDPERRLLAWPGNVATTTLASVPQVLFHP